MTKDADGIVLGVIPARIGSRRVKKKNIRLLGNPPRPLIAYSIEQAKLAKSLDYFVISTGDPEIREVSINNLGGVSTQKACVIKRPPELCEDVDSALVLKNAVEWFEKKKKQSVSHVCLLQPTSPLRSYHDIDECVHLAKATNADTVVSVKKVDEHPMWCFQADIFGRLESFMNTRLEGDNLVSQNLPLLYYPNGAVYVTNRATIAQNKIFGNKMYPYKMPRNRSIDLEEEIDFIICSAIMPVFRTDEPYLVRGCNNG